MSCLDIYTHAVLNLSANANARRLLLSPRPEQQQKYSSNFFPTPGPPRGRALERGPRASLVAHETDRLLASRGGLPHIAALRTALFARRIQQERKSAHQLAGAQTGCAGLPPKHVGGGTGRSTDGPEDGRKHVKEKGGVFTSRTIIDLDVVDHFPQILVFSCCSGQ